MKIEADINPRIAAQGVVDALRARLGLQDGWIDKNGWLVKDISTGHRERLTRIRKVSDEEKMLIELADNFLEAALKVFK
jgi:hypothetical protein